jgi:Flp pilus assembly CpaF family ATPase
MKRIACLGTMVAPLGRRAIVPANQLIELYNDIRNYAREYEVSSVFIVKEQTFILIMEGEAPSIGGLTRLLNADERVIDVSVVANLQVDDAQLSGCTIRVIKPDDDSRQDYLDKLRGIIGARLDLKQPFDKRRIRQIFGRHGASAKVPVGKPDRDTPPHLSPMG